MVQTDNQDQDESEEYFMATFSDINYERFICQAKHGAQMFTELKR